MKRRRCSLGGNERGFALPLAVLASLVLIVLSMSVYTVSSARNVSAKSRHNYVAAFYAAESGINEALYRLQDQGAQPVPFSSDPSVMGSDAFYSVAYQDLGDGRYTIVSAGGWRNQSRTVTLDVQSETTSESVYLFPQDIVAISAQEGEPFYYPYPNPFPPVTFTIPSPEGTPESLTLNNNQTQTVSGNHWYTSLTLNNNSTLTINGSSTIWITGPVTIKQGAELKVTGTGGLTLYITTNLNLNENSTVSFTGTGENRVFVNGNVTLDNSMNVMTASRTRFYVGGSLSFGNCDVNVDEEASNLIFFLTTDDGYDGDTVNLKNNAHVRAGIYAPTADVNKLWNNSYLHGAVVGNAVVKDGQAEADYDESLREFTLESFTGNNSWRVLPGTWSSL